MRACPFRLADGVIAAVCAATALFVFIFTRLGAPAGAQVVIEAAGQSPITCSLSADQTLSLTGKDHHTLTVVIQGGRVSVKDSTCPDHLCEHSGWLSRGGQSAVCVPAGISVRVVGGQEALDGVTA